MRTVSRLPARRATRAYIRRWEPRVRTGPFAGLLYDRLVARLAHDVAAKLIGSYERELSDFVECAVAVAPEHVVNVGCAEGFYAVGIARRLPNATVAAYDLDPTSRRLCRRLADINGVAGRVSVHAEFTTALLTPGSGARLLLFDCEGCEEMLTSPEVGAVLENDVLLVELHEWNRPGLAERIAEPLGESHEVTIIDAQPRYRNEYPELGELRRLADVELDMLLNERRPDRMRWLIAWPRALGLPHELYGGARSGR